MSSETDISYSRYAGCQIVSSLSHSSPRGFLVVCFPVINEKDKRTVLNILITVERRLSALIGTSDSLDNRQFG